MNQIIQWATVHGEMEIYGTRSRIGHAERARAKAHVNKMMEEGRLSGKEAGIRVNFIEKAETDSQINQATRDLPPVPVPLRQAWLHPDWKEPKFFVPVFIVTSVLSVAFAGTPYVLGTWLHFYHNKAMMNALGIPAIVIGFLGLFASIVASSIKLADSHAERLKTRGY